MSGAEFFEREAELGYLARSSRARHDVEIIERVESPVNPACSILSSRGWLTSEERRRRPSLNRSAADVSGSGTSQGKSKSQGQLAPDRH